MKQIKTWTIGPNPPDIHSGWIYKGTARYFNNGKWEVLGEFDLMDKIETLSSDADLSAVIAKVNELIIKLQEAGIMKS